MTAISDVLKTELMPIAEQTQVADVRIGLGYTAVKLEPGQLGMAFTFSNEHQVGCSVFRGPRPLAGSSAATLLALLGSERRSAAAVGLATANALALTTLDHAALEQGDVLNVMKITSSDTVGMIGFFGPLIPIIKRQAANLLIFEQSSTHGAGILPAKEAPNRLPDCSVVFITATSLINNTFDELMTWLRPHSRVAVLGASTPLTARAFVNQPVAVLSGIVPLDQAKVLQVVSEGGGTPDFQPYVQKVNLIINSGLGR